MTDDFLGRVSRPSRYIGHEVHAIRKDPDRVRTRVALAFPDTYEIGMSHTGLKILYEILNRREDTAAERVFAPWKDMEAVLREAGAPLASMESGRPLGDFDILGFTLQYEMSYTNILNMLDLAGIPLQAEDRDASHPLVIAGGPCAFNPEPLAPFFDLFVIGDGEEVIEEIVEVVQEQGREDREALVRRLGGIPGIYVPSHFAVSTGPDGRIRRIARAVSGPERIRKRLLPDLDRAPYPCAPVVPYMKVVHDRATLEISRGCTRGCRFCQAGMIYRPVREREVATILDLFRETVNATGYEEASLVSLSSGDYSELDGLVREVVGLAQERHVSVSLPSLRPGALSLEVIQEIVKIRKTGFTIAPEAGTQRLRDVINKGIDEEAILETVDRVFGAGWEILKLYFMIGLPTETREDLEGIIDLTLRVLKRARTANPRFKQINVSISPFVPKPHTPFQWAAQDRPESVREKYRILKRGLRNRKIRLKWHDPGISMVEGVLSRGDRRVGRAVEAAWRSGCRFDGWTEEFDPERWAAAFREAEVDPAFYCYRERDAEEIFPWDLLDAGITREFLAAEYARSLRAETTPDCRNRECTLCGACTGEEGLRLAGPLAEGRGNVPRRTSPAVKRFRIRYAKEGRLRFLSHLELITLWIRSFARAGVPLEYSQGFHPHPRLAMGPALPVGVTGGAEYLDVNVLGAFFEEPLRRRLNEVLPEGVRVTGLNWIPAKAPAVSSVIRFGGYRVHLPRPWIPGDPEAVIREILEREVIPVERVRKGKSRTVNIRPVIEEASLSAQGEEEIVLDLLLRTGDQGSARLQEVIGALFGLDEEALATVRMERTGLFVDRRRRVPFQEKKAAAVL